MLKNDLDGRRKLVLFLSSVMYNKANDPGGSDPSDYDTGEDADDGEDSASDVSDYGGGYDGSGSGGGDSGGADEGYEGI